MRELLNWLIVGNLLQILRNGSVFITKKKDKRLKTSYRKDYQRFTITGISMKKSLLGNGKALIGSSNLTKKGITDRVGMSVLIKEKSLVKELKTWFCDLWEESKPTNT